MSCRSTTIKITRYSTFAAVLRDSYLYHFAAAKQSATRVARIEKAMPAIFEGRGFLERR
jgi:uncharacterized protein YdeI (YjbR/CyaY-like superfamily)